MYTRIKTTEEIANLRQAGGMLATVLDVLKNRLQTGMSTKDLAEIAKVELKSLGGRPSFLGYQGFPDVLCVSVNDEVVHGIPRPDVFINYGDIVSLDFGVTYRGMVADSAISTTTGQTSNRDQKLISTTDRALSAGIDVVKDGVRVGDIAAAVQSVLGKAGYGIVEDLVGHGVGHELHEEPNIPNYGIRGTGDILRAGMTIAIEPMATLGGHKVYVDRDGWTVRTVDKSRAAHFEHTVLITENGADILTRLQ